MLSPLPCRLFFLVTNSDRCGGVVISNDRSGISNRGGILIIAWLAVVAGMGSIAGIYRNGERAIGLCRLGHVDFVLLRHKIRSNRAS